MRVMILSKGLIAGASQRKLEELAKFGIELTLVAPPYWLNDDGNKQMLERLYTSGYQLIETPIRLNGNYHLHYYPELGKIMRQIRPEIVHIEEEPYNYATFHAMRLAEKQQARTLFYAFQNMLRNYPPPFRQFELYNYRHVTAAIAGSREVGDVLMRKGYRGALYIIPFGFDTNVFKRSTPRPPRRPGDVFTLGYIGRLKEEKGLATIIEALTRLPDYCRAVFIGYGPMQSALEEQAARLGVAERVTIRPGVPTAQIPHELEQLDVLVLPSLTRPNWKEQFGRILAEAMSCETPVIGSDSGEIPHVIGDGGLIFKEGDARELGACVMRLLDNPALYVDLAWRGRQRVLENYSLQQIARQTYEVYRKITE